MYIHIYHNYGLTYLSVCPCLISQWLSLNHYFLPLVLSLRKLIQRLFKILLSISAFAVLGLLYPEYFLNSASLNATHVLEIY